MNSFQYILLLLYTLIFCQACTNEEWQKKTKVACLSKRFILQFRNYTIITYRILYLCNIFNIIKQIVFHTFQMVHASYMHNKYIKKILITFSTTISQYDKRMYTFYFIIMFFICISYTMYKKKSSQLTPLLYKFLLR